MNRLERVSELNSKEAGDLVSTRTTDAAKSKLAY